MKKILLAGLLIASNLTSSQSTSTQNIDDSQVKEIYKGLKQNEYLKLRLQKTDNALTSAQNLINEQEKSISSFKNLANSKDQIISNLEEVRKQELNISRERETQLKADINILEGDLKVMEIEAKIKQRKRFWGGVKIGVVGTLVAGAVAGFLIMNSK